jgi:PKD repeat protein
MVLSSACDKVPLLAPSGTVITIFPVASTVPLNGEVEIVATVIEQGAATAPPTTPPPTNGNNGGTNPPPGTTTPPTTTTPTTTTGAGTPVQNGTLVTFTTTLGRIEPSEARTNNGQVRVKFISGNQSGTATITAFSGGASGRLENLRVGTAAVERVIVNANPQTLGAAGGTAEISARVEDVSGLPVVGVPVTFSTSSGQITPNPANTDQNGIARSTLTTTREATVTATVAGKTSGELTVGLNPRTGIGIVAPDPPPAAGQPAVFTVNVSAEANIRNVRVSWGDGDTDDLGAISGETPVVHIFNDSGTFRVTATATDANGFSEPVSTVVVILPAQPPSVLVTPSDPNPAVGQVITITATVSGNTSSIIEYRWDFGDGTTRTTTSAQTTHAYGSVGTRTIIVTAVQATGPTGTGAATVTVSATATAGR